MQTIYMDYNATTPIDPQVLSAMQPYLHEHFGNPASSTHMYGWTAEEAVSKARRQVAKLLNCNSHEIYFTSGSTESNNWALRGVIEKLKLENPGAPLHVISSSIEHSSVKECLEYLKKLFAIEISWAKVTGEGQVDISDVRKLIKPHTRLLSFMWVNNEIGTINPMQELGEIAREAKAYLHCDATQAVGKVPIDLKNTPVDLLSISAHKAYGPKGVGALYVRGQNPKVQLSPFFLGGGQERGERSGTLNVAGIVGLGKTCEIVSERITTDIAKLTALRDQLWTLLSEAFPTARLNGHLTARAPNLLNVTFINYKVPVQFPGLAVSKSSACHSGPQSHSHVLTHLGFSEKEMDSTIRFSLGRMTNEEELKSCIEILKKTLSKI